MLLFDCLYCQLWPKIPTKVFISKAIPDLAATSMSSLPGYLMAVKSWDFVDFENILEDNIKFSLQIFNNTEIHRISFDSKT